MLPVLMTHLSLAAIAVAQLPSIPGICPSEADRQILFQDTIQQPPSFIETCGQRDWREVINFDAANVSQECPQNWNLVTDTVRRCEGSVESTSTMVDVPFTYSSVCGRVSGIINEGNGDAFFRGHIFSATSVDDNYIDGAFIAHRGPTSGTHVWSFAAGSSRCPCANNNTDEAPIPPSFVGDNYFCDNSLNGILWDGQACITECCTFNNPPWFFTSIGPTSQPLEVTIRNHDMINVRIGVTRVQIFIEESTLE